MTYVRLNGADQKRVVFPAPLSIDCRCGIQLDGVADDSARAMCFQVVHVRWANARAGERFLNRLLLGGCTWYGKPLACPVLIHGDASYDAPNTVTVGLGLA